MTQVDTTLPFNDLTKSDRKEIMTKMLSMHSPFVSKTLPPSPAEFFAHVP